MGGNDSAGVAIVGIATCMGAELYRHQPAFREEVDRCAEWGFCAIGSVKKQHWTLEQTAGLAGLIKTALALKQGKIPPSLNFHTANLKIDSATETMPSAKNTSAHSEGAEPRELAWG